MPLDVPPAATVVGVITWATMMSVFLWRQLTKRAARRGARIVVAISLALVIALAVLWLRSAVHGAAVVAGMGFIVVITSQTDAFVRLTGGPRRFESLMAAITMIGDALKGVHDPGFEAQTRQVLDAWRRELDRWRDPDTAELVDQCDGVLDAWPTEATPRDAALVEQISDLHVASEGYLERFERGGADVRDVARVLRYPIA